MSKSTIAMAPFFETLQSILLAGDLPEPAPAVVRHSCRHCRDGEREDGSLCPYDGMADEPDDGDDISLQQALKNMGIG